MGNSAQAVRCLPETERTLAFGGISGAYAAVGTPLAHPAIALRFYNQTDAPMSFSFDGTNAHISLASGATFDFEVQNLKGLGGAMQVAKGTQFYVKQISAPGSGSVFIDAFYGANFDNL